jgi:hypothetical protein
MRATECAALINDVIYRPEWTIKATAVDDQVEISFLINTVNTDRECAREGYQEERTLNPGNVLDPSLLASRYDVYAVLMAMIMELELHEAREFLRVKSDDFNAPYHPHRAEGNRAWSEYFG